MKNKNTYRRSKGLYSGFTLIELLIVITIIGILAAALLPSVLAAPARARDVARKADVGHIIQAVETYNSDEGSYPTGSGCVDAVASKGLLKYFQGGRAPVDPGNKGVGSCVSGYFYCELPATDGQQSYMVAAYTELIDNATTNETDVTDACTDAVNSDPGDDPFTAPSQAPFVYVVIQ